MRIISYLAIVFCLNIFPGCNDTNNQAELDTQYLEKLNSYRAGLKERSRLEYLELIGRYPVDSSIVSKIGAAPDSRIYIEYEDFPDTLGTVWFKNDSLHFKISGNSSFNVESDSSLTEHSLPVTGWVRSPEFEMNRFSWHFLKRGDGYFLRVRDHDNPAIRDFKGYKWFEPNPQFIFNGSYTEYAQPVKKEVPSIFEFKETTEFIGSVSFTYSGSEYSLEIGENGFLMFGDETSALSTYGAGRYLWVDLPSQDGPVVIDFNYSYNPPCIFSEYTTCMFAPPQNRLPFRITAGETNTSE